MYLYIRDMISIYNVQNYSEWAPSDINRLDQILFIQDIQELIGMYKNLMLQQHLFRRRYIQLHCIKQMEPKTQQAQSSQPTIPQPNNLQQPTNPQQPSVQNNVPQPVLLQQVPQYSNYQQQVPQYSNYQQQPIAINPPTYIQQSYAATNNAPQYQIPSNLNQYVPQQVPNANSYQQMPINQNTFDIMPMKQNTFDIMPMNQNTFEQLPVPMFGSYGNMGYGQNVAESHTGLTLLNSKEEDKNKKVVAVIVTFCNGSSYDNLFTTVEQKSMEGTRVLVYSCASQYLGSLIKAFEGEPQDDIAKELISQIKQVDHDCVVFNWECSSGYSGQNFTEGKNQLFKFLKMILDHKHMAMFSDFSLKALINDWDEHQLGPNPFRKVGETSSEFVMKFKPAILKECPSSQLQIIGDMAEGGQCHVHCLGGTILYSVDKNKLNHDLYTVQVLTVNTTNQTAEENLKCYLDHQAGVASHVLLKFKSGGLLLTSMGHWVELMKVDTSDKKLFEIAQKQYGAVYAQQMKQEYMAMPVQAQQAYVQQKATYFVQNQAPCSNMYKKYN